MGFTTIREYLDILEYDKNLKELPKILDVRKRFLRLAKESHPDKCGGSDSKFRQIYEAYKKLSHHILKNTPEVFDDVEESIARKEFQEAHIMKLNKTSIRIKFPSMYGPY